MATKHTPAPWIYALPHKGSYGEIVYTSDMKTWVVNCSSPNLSTEQSKANAHLIAAAPELLEALKEFLDLEFPEGALDNTLAQMAVEKALKAINKAEGK